MLLGATVSVYINQKFTWTLSKDPFGAQAACISVPVHLRLQACHMIAHASKCLCSTCNMLCNILM